MSRTTSLAAVAVAATLALAAGDLSASAQGLPNGPNGMQSNGLPSKDADGPNGHSPSRAMMHGRTVRRSSAAMHKAEYMPRRPLTVRRTTGVAEQPVVVAPAVAGPANIITGPLGFASSVVSLPFRAFGGIFPATGDINTNPLVIIGAPIHAIGDIVQFPLRVLGAPFGGTDIATY